MPAYSHLLDEERDEIAVMRAAGRSICAIARALQRAKSTVSRELRRNALSSGRYSPLHAAGAYQLRRRRDAIPEFRREVQHPSALSLLDFSFLGAAFASRNAAEGGGEEGKSELVGEPERPKVLHFALESTLRSVMSLYRSGPWIV